MTETTQSDFERGARAAIQHLGGYYSSDNGDLCLGMRVGVGEDEFSPEWEWQDVSDADWDANAESAIRDAIWWESRGGRR